LRIKDSADFAEQFDYFEELKLTKLNLPSDDKNARAFPKRAFSINQL